MYKVIFGIFANGFDKIRPIDPVRVLSFNAETNPVAFYHTLGRLNTSGSIPINVDVIINKDLEELVREHSDRLRDNKEYKDNYHELDIIGRAYIYTGTYEIKHGFTPMILTSNPYWLDMDLWEEIPIYKLKEILNNSLPSEK